MDGTATAWQIRAISAILDKPPHRSQALDLAGPEALTHRELVKRAAALYQRRPWVLPVPGTIARAFAALAERFSQSPPITPAMLDVLERDDRVDSSAAFSELGVVPTPLDETLRRYVGPEATAR